MTFAIGNVCPGGGHADLNTLVNGQQIDSDRYTIEGIKNELLNPTNAELTAAVQVLLGYALDQANPQTKAQAQSTIESCTVVLNWTNP